MKGSIIWSVIILVLMGPATAQAVIVTFSFPITLVKNSCSGFSFCGDPAKDGRIVTVVYLADPYADQAWSTGSYSVGGMAPFPTWEGSANTAEGSYTYDDETGIGTASLSDYFLRGDNTFSPGLGGYLIFELGPTEWLYDAAFATGTQSVSYTPAITGLAFAAFGPPVPVPPAIVFLGSGLAALIFRRATS